MTFPYKKLLLLCLLLITIGWLIYGQALSFGLITQDDFITINYPKTYPNLLSRPMTIFTTPMPESAFFWMPVTGLSFLTDILICPTAYHVLHLTNIVLHACNAIILFLLLSYTTKKIWAGFLVALIFTVHPLNVETVVVITNRAALLSMFFWLMTIVAYVYYTQRPSVGRYGLMLMFFILGLMAKPSIAGYVFCLPLLDIWPLCRFHRRLSGSGTDTKTDFALSPAWKLVLEKVPIVAVAIGWGMMTSYLFTRISFYRSPVFFEARNQLLSRAVNIPVSWMGYLYKFFVPVRLNYFTPAPPLKDFSVGQGLAAALGVAGITFFLLLFLRRQKPLVSGWLWFLICITPHSITNALLQNFVTSRYAYFPMIGLAIMVVWGTFLLSRQVSSKWKNIFIFVLAGLTIPLFILARAQVGHWESRTALYRHAISIDPDKSMLHLNLGRELFKNGDINQALTEFRVARDLCPECPEPVINLGLAYLAKNEPHLALTYLEKGLAIQPDNISVNQNLAKLFIRQERYAEAIDLLEQLITIRPDYSVSIAYQLAVLYAHQNDVAKTVSWLDKCLKKNPAMIAVAEKEPIFCRIRKEGYFRKYSP
jgi:hypothetical protein